MCKIRRGLFYVKRPPEELHTVAKIYLGLVKFVICNSCGQYWCTYLVMFIDIPMTMAILVVIALVGFDLQPNSDVVDVITSQNVI